MAQRVNKAIVTNRSALKVKYGAGESDIREALNKLIAADKSRGLKTQLIDISSTSQMKRVKGKPVSSVTNLRQTKSAVDKIYQALVPDYILLLGSIDVIAHQDLVNPAAGDPDQTADSDLPYACEHGYSRKIEDFLGPTRVVGRLPDLTGADDPTYLLELLDTAAEYESRPKKDYTDYLGISAKVWQGSTRASLKNIFGSSADLKTSPPDGPGWTAAQLRRRSHFINCHGAQADFKFYGQQGSQYPDAHDASLIDGRLAVGTVVAAECCYGAELYDPSVTAGQAGICNTCLANGSYAFFGSSTVAYGPADGNGAADLMAQYFLKNVLSGASTGRAALQARQEYLLKNPVLDPIDLKTMAQFNLMGDPAVHPVSRTPPTHMVATSKAMKSLTGAAREVAAGLGMRRASLLQNGIALASAVVSALADEKLIPSKTVRDLLDETLAEVHAELIDHASFVLAPAVALAATAGANLARIAPIAATIHLAIGRLKGAGPSPRLCAVVAREQNGAIVVRRLFSR